MGLSNNRVKPISIITIILASSVLSFNNCSQTNFTPQDVASDSTMASSSTNEASDSNGNSNSTGSSTNTTTTTQAPPPASGTVITSLTGTLSSNIDSVSSSGLVYGYAVDSTQKTKSMKVFFFADGPAGVGALLGESFANTGTVGSNAGHYFSFKIPISYADGKTHKIYAYGFSPEAANLIKSSAMSYVAYTPKAQTLYDTQLSSSVQNRCNGCHSFSYTDLLYGQLLKPGPLSGGSAINNGFYNKVNGGHNGNSCSNFPCTSIQAWWTAEFK
jgi:hypothetical protein